MHAYVQDSIFLCVYAYILLPLNVSQRAESRSAKEIKDENTVGQRVKQRRDFESSSGGEKLGKDEGKGE